MCLQYNHLLINEPEAFGLRVGVALLAKEGAEFQIKIALSSLIPLKNSVNDIQILTYLDSLEAELKTPVQTAVKRIDEQKFARLNGQNTMFVEDALRIISKACTLTIRSARVVLNSCLQSFFKCLK